MAVKRHYLSAQVQEN